MVPQNATLAAVKRDRAMQRLIGNFGFSDVIRQFRRRALLYGSAKDSFTFAGAVPTSGVYQTDGWGWNRIGFGYAAYTRQSGGKNHAADTRLFVIEYDDFRHILKTDNPPLGRAPRRPGEHSHRNHSVGAPSPGSRSST